MAQKRIEWACPECGKRFAIPADANMPERCPTCQQVATEQTATKAKAPPPPLPITPPVVAVTETPLPNIGEMPVEPVEIEAPSISVPPPQRSRTSNRNVPRNYKNLRNLSLASRVLGGLILVATLWFNVSMSLDIVEMNDKHLFKTTSEFLGHFLRYNTLIFLTGCTFGIFMLALSELIPLMIDVENNTHDNRNPD